MEELGKRFGNILGHRDVDVASIVVPVDGEAKVTGAGPIFGKGIFLFEGMEQVVGVRAREVFDAEVVNGKGECGGACVVYPNTRRVANWVVAEGGKVVAELFVGENAGLFEAVHAFSNFQIEVSFGVEMGIGESVFSYDLGCDIATMDAHVLVDFHVGGEEKIFEVSGAVSSTIFGIGDGAVEMEFGVNNANGRRTNILKGIETVTADGHANAARFGFAGSHGADKVGIGDFATGRDFGRENEEHGVVAKDGCTRCSRLEKTRGAAAPFVGKRKMPDGTVGAVKKGVDRFLVPGDGIVDFAGDRRIMDHGGFAGWDLGREDGLREESRWTRRPAKASSKAGGCSKASVVGMLFVSFGDSDR